LAAKNLQKAKDRFLPGANDEGGHVVDTGGGKTALIPIIYGLRATASKLTRARRGLALANVKGREIGTSATFAI